MKRLSLLSPTFATPVFWIAMAAFGVSVGLEFYGRACGFNFTSDSIQYLSSAKSFHGEGKFLGDDGTYNPYWPPLFPMLLSFTTSPLVFLVWINLICKIMIAGVTLYLANTFLKSLFYKSAFIIASMLSVYMLMISVFVWTELLFLALLLLNSYFALHLQRQKYLYGLLVTGFLLCMQRNAGLFWISGICVWMLLNGESTFRKNLAQSVLVFSVSTSGLWAWNIYNTFFLPADFVFYERPFFEGFSENSVLMMGAFVKMGMPIKSTLFQILVFIFLTAFVLYFVQPAPGRFFLVVIGVYAAGFMVLGKLDAYDIDRYLSVIAPVVFLVMAMGMERVSQNAGKWLRLGILLITVLWLGYTILRSVKNVQFWYERSCLTESSR